MRKATQRTAPGCFAAETIGAGTERVVSSADRRAARKVQSGMRGPRSHRCVLVVLVPVVWLACDVARQGRHDAASGRRVVMREAALQEAASLARPAPAGVEASNPSEPFPSPKPTALTDGRGRSIGILMGILIGVGVWLSRRRLGD